MFSTRLQNLHPYIPGEQPTDKPYIKLNANENPYPPAPAVLDAIKDALAKSPEKLGLYPDPDANALRESIADMLNKSGGVLCRTSINEGECTPGSKDKIPFSVTKDMIFCGNGSDEVLSFVFYTFCDSSKPLIFPKYTYSFYPVYCGYYNIPMITPDLKDNWQIDTDAMLKEASKGGSTIIFANPNAPTGLSLKRSEVKALLEKMDREQICIVDEAYCDFGGESCIPLIKDFSNLVIVRTFSKSLSFAGMRLGYVVASEPLIKALFTVKNSFNHFPVDFLAQTAGIASCKNVAYYAQNAKTVAAERDSLIEFLREKGWYVIDSLTNFVFAKKPGVSGEDIYQAVKRDGILIRHFNTEGIEDFVRITIGTKEQMTALKDVLQKGEIT